VIDNLLTSQSQAALDLVTQTRTQLEQQVAAGRLDAAERRGAAIAGQMLRRAGNDGADRVVSNSPPPFTGAWQPTPPAFAAALEPAAGDWRTWNSRRGDEHRPPAPLRPSNAGYAEQVTEVYKTARSLTAEQIAIAQFWADGPGTVTPPGHWNQITLDLLDARPRTLRFTTSVLATLNTAQADAFIACWDAKYAYYSERPVTAIRRELDPNFLPLITTPPFPSYVSGHSTTSAAASKVLGAFFPDEDDRLRAMAQEAAISRLYGGIHFRADNDAGLVLGKKVAADALRKVLG
jgi:PAP2 superfamily